MTNRHTVDELADVRAEIKILKEREAELRNEILLGKCGLVGDEWLASVRNVLSARLDMPAARKALGNMLKPFLVEFNVTTVRLEKREGVATPSPEEV